MPGFAYVHSILSTGGPLCYLVSKPSEFCVMQGVKNLRPLDAPLDTIHRRNLIFLNVVNVEKC